MVANFTFVADNFFGAIFNAPFLLLIYLVPVLWTIGFTLKTDGRFFLFINKIFGAGERIVRPFRDSIFAAYLTLGSVWYVWRGIQTARVEDIAYAVIGFGLVLAGFLRIRSSRHQRIEFLKFIQKFPNIHPREFFDRETAIFGITRQILPETPTITVDLANIDFRRKTLSKYVGIFSIIIGVAGTVVIVRLILLAKKMGTTNLRLTASALSIVWATHVAFLARSAVYIEGIEKLPGHEGHQIFLFTHASFLDFAFVPLVIASRRFNKDETKIQNCLPVFLLAKDHFQDNFIFRNFIGIGRAAEALGMIFVDRKASNKKETAKKIAADAAFCLTNGGGPIAIFPQGSRALPFFGTNNERLGAGYYTVGSAKRIAEHGAHLKKGASYIAAEVKDALLIPVAITGSAVACPRGSIKILSNIQIKFHVGDVIHAVKGENIEWLQSKTDNSLKEKLRIHAELERRFLETIRTILDPMQIDEVALAMKSWRGSDYLYYAILDAIYSLKPSIQRNLLGEFIHLILDLAPREDFLEFKRKVAYSIGKGTSEK